MNSPRDHSPSFMWVTLLAMASGAFPCVLTAQVASEIIRQSENAIKGETSRGTFEMIVTTPSYSRSMVMDSWWVGNDKALISIKSPKKEAGNKWLKIKNEMWSYLRNTETTIKMRQLELISNFEARNSKQIRMFEKTVTETGLNAIGSVFLGVSVIRICFVMRIACFEFMWGI